MNQFLIFAIQVIGWLFIWRAVEYKRTPECKIELFSKEGLIQFLILLFGVILTSFAK